MISPLISKKKKGVKYLSLPLISLLLISCFSLFLPVSCRYYRLERKLDPESAEFLSKVRYIISSKERKIFLELPDSEKEIFKGEFWKRRDPDPNTEENEFKMEYFDRIEKANYLFRSEAKPGYMTDRGRILILFGPPPERITNPMSFGGGCEETWLYGNFPVVFVDSTCSGNYRLISYNLTGLRSFNLMYMHELGKAQAKFQQTIRGETKFFDFNWNVKKTLVEPDRVEGIIIIDVPHANIWFKEEDDKLGTTLELRLELKDWEGHLVWEHEDSFKVETDEEELRENKKKKFEIEIPFVLVKDLDRLYQGKNKLFAFLKNRTGAEELQKIMEVNF